MPAASEQRPPTPEEFTEWLKEVEADIAKPSSLPKRETGAEHDQHKPPDEHSPEPQSPK